MTNESKSRREFIKNSGKAGIAAGLSLTVLPALACTTAKVAHITATPYDQTPLPFGYSALEPVIDAQTMELHYTKHAAGYAKNLNEAIAAENVNSKTTSLEDLLSGISKYSTKMRNNAGGHYNHELFWKCMQSLLPRLCLPGNSCRRLKKISIHLLPLKTNSAKRLKRVLEVAGHG